MKTKAVIAVCIGALVCGAWGSSALAKSKHKHRAAQTASTQTQQAPTMPGNNPMNNPKTSAGAPNPNTQAPAAIPGNNPMKVR